MTPRVTRLAPSPTGALHLGNARTFLINWALARRSGWRIVLRIEDLDTPRIKSGAAEGIVRTLRALGLDWDEGPYIQSHDLSAYERAMQRLAREGLAYPCDLSRGEIEAATSAPNQGDHEQRFDASLRPASAGRSLAFEPGAANWRFVVPEREVVVDDAFAGPTRQNPARLIGDFVVWTRRGQPSYQLAVVVDDAGQGVTDIVRGDDLLSSAARQMLLYEALGLGPAPTYFHLPLVRGADGRRLAKRHGDTRVESYLNAGVEPGRLIALMARWCGMGSHDHLTSRGFADHFDLHTIPRADIVFSEWDDRWLRGG